MVRRVTPTLVVTLLVAVAAGGGAQPLQIEIWGNVNHLEVLKPLIAEFNASQDRIEVVIPGKTEDEESILGAALAGKLPDIIESDRIYNQRYHTDGLLISLEPFIAREGPGFLDDWFPFTLHSDNMVDGKIVSLPFRLEFLTMHYNERLFEEAGLSAPMPGWTWSDVEGYAAKVRRIAPDGSMEIWGLVAEHPLSFDYPLMGQAGGPTAPGGVFVSERLESLVNSDHVRSTYDWIISMAERGLLGHGYANIHPGASAARMHHAGLVQAGPMREQMILAAGSALRPAPPLRARPDNAPAATYADRSLAIMNVSPDRQEAAWEVIKWLFRPDVQARWNVAMGIIPATRSAISHPIFQETAHENILRWGRLYTAGGVVNTLPWPMIVWTTDLAGQAYEYSRRLVKGEIGLEEYVTEFGRAVRNALEELRSR